MSTPNTGIPYVPEGTTDPAAGLNLSLNVIDALLQTAVISMSETAPPGSPADGDLYVPSSPATGLWAGQENNVARYVSEGAFWQFYAAGVNVWIVLNLADNALYAFDNSASPGSWAPAIAGTPSNITVQDDDSPPTEVVTDLSVLVIGTNLTLTEISAGVALLEATGGGGGGASNITPDTHPVSADNADDEFETGSAIDTAGTRFSGATAWAWLNQGGATDAVDSSRGNLRINGVTGADVIRGVVQAAPGTPWRYRAKISVVTNALDFAHGGLFVYNSGTTEAITFGLQWVSSLNVRTVRYSNLSTAVTQINISALPGVMGQPVPLYLEIANDGTDLVFRVSASGCDGTFQTLSTEPLATHITAVTDIGIYADPGGAGVAPVTVCDWFRREA